jgi:MSHA pilin protein MshD
MSIRRRPARRVAQAGFTFVELIMFIVIVGVGVAGILLAYSTAVRGSSDPLVNKQMLSIAEALLEEVQLMPFTVCDPDDANAATATTTAGCASTPEAIGPEAGESRYNASNPFDNVNDYNGFNTATDALPGIRDLSGTPIAALAGYSASVSVAATALGPGGSQVPASGANGALSLLITVTVTAPRGDTLALSGYRTRYAPTAVP